MENTAESWRCVVWVVVGALARVLNNATLFLTSLPDGEAALAPTEKTMKRTQQRWWLATLAGSFLLACSPSGTGNPSSTSNGGPNRPQGETQFSTRTGGSSRNSSAGGGTPGANEDASANGGDRAPTAGGGAPRAIEESDIYKVVGNNLFILNRYRGLQIVDISNLDAPRVIGRAPIYGWPKDMYVRGDKAYIIVSDYWSFWRDDLAADDVATAPFYGSQLRIVDISNVQSPTVVGGINLDGDCSDSRIVGDVLYTVSQRYPWYSYDGSSDNEDKTTVVSIDISDTQNVHVVDTADFPRNGWQHHLSVTADTIYVAASGYRMVDNVNWDYRQFTKITHVDITDPAGDIRVRGDIEVEGAVPDRWAMDEYNDVLRVASGEGWGNGDVILTTINVQNPDALTQLGRYVLRVNENLTAARFDGPRGYLVSYRNIDPLFTFDLSNPASPALLSELEMTGWLDFLVPMGDRMVALGHEDTNAAGERQISLAVSLIDTAQGHAPALLDREVVGENWGWVPGERDDFAKVFRVLPEQNLILLPFQSWSSTDWRYVGGVQILDVTRDGLQKRGLIQNAGWVERGVPHGPNTVFTISSEVFQVMDIADRDSPAVRARLELARNVTDFALLGDDNTVQLHGDWWRGDTYVAVVPKADPDSASPISSVHIPAPYGRMFKNGNLVYISSVQQETDANGVSRGVGKVQIVDLSDAANPVIRGTVNLPEEVYSSYGYWYWGYGDQVVQANGSTLVFFRYRYNHWYDRYEGDANSAEVQPTHTLYIVDLSNPDAPAVASTVSLEGVEWAWGLQARGNSVFFSQYESFQQDDSWYARYFLRKVDISNPSAPVLSAPVNIPGMFIGAKEDNRTVYTVENWYDDQLGRSRTYLHALELFGDLAYLQSSVEIPGYTYNLVVNGNSAFTSTTNYGYRVVGGEQQWYQEAKLYSLDLSNTQAIRVADSEEIPQGWGWLMDVQGGRAFVSTGPGIFSYVVNDVNNLQTERFFRTQGWAQSLVVEQNRAFVPSGYYGVQVLTLGQSN